MQVSVLRQASQKLARRRVAIVLFAAVVCFGSQPLRAADEPPATSTSPQSSAPAADAKGEKLERGSPEKGERLYNRYCRGCHGENGKGDGLVFMPHVDNLTRKGYIDTLPDSYLMLAIQKGGPGIGKSTYMPAWEGTLSREQMLDIIGYIRSLPLN